MASLLGGHVPVLVCPAGGYGTGSTLEAMLSIQLGGSTRAKTGRCRRGGELPLHCFLDRLRLIGRERE